MLLPYLHEDLIEAGCDEAGRGALAGPVFAAAVILPKGYTNDMINDSKQLTAAQRTYLKDVIQENALGWAVGITSVKDIEKHNILNATLSAMHSAIKRLQITPEHLLIDGNQFKPYHKIPHTTIIKGDAQYMSIAAASILAKYYRDDYMDYIHMQYPYFGWCNNKGYPTVKHRQAIRIFGASEHHRHTFNLLGK
jgi:ribonuclease HII